MIDERAAAVGFAALQRAAAAISDAYRQGQTARITTEDRTAAYLVTRMPATYAASRMVLEEVHERAAPVASILDVGAGTGAASLAAHELFPDAAITMIERDSAMSEAARQWLPDAKVISGDATQILALPPHDLVIASYALGEFAAEIAPRLWQAARAAMIAIEPGTPRGFAQILGIRDSLLAAGAYMLAPCPAGTPCPVRDPDWCHFAARVERSSIHRRIKQAELGYEDEKFSYVALSREPVELARARIVRRPQHQPGLIVLETCTPQGLQTHRVKKRDREPYREARRAHWGSAIYHGLDDDSGRGVEPAV